MCFHTLSHCDSLYVVQICKSLHFIHSIDFAAFTKTFSFIFYVKCHVKLVMESRFVIIMWLQLLFYTFW